MYKIFFKRFLDIIVSLTFILCFWWLYVVIAILVRIKLGSQILFKQDRPGQNEKNSDNRSKWSCKSSC